MPRCIDARFEQALTTTNQFLDALAAAQLLQVREASVRRAEEQLKTSVAKLRAGSATRSDSCARWSHWAMRAWTGSPPRPSSPRPRPTWRD